MTHGERRYVRIATVVLVLASCAFFAPVAAQSVDGIQTTLTDENGDGLQDRVQVEVTVSNVGSGQTIVELGESNFDVDVSPTDTTDGNQAQFATPMDPDEDGTNEAVEFVTVGTASTTYTVVADLSNQTGGETGSVDVELGGSTTDSATYTVGGQGGEGNDGDGDADTGTDGEGDGNQEQESNGQNDGSASDGGSDASDGTGTGGESDGTDDGSGSEGLPGFTAVVALLALVLSAAYYKNRD